MSVMKKKHINDDKEFAFLWSLHYHHQRRRQDSSPLKEGTLRSFESQPLVMLLFVFLLLLTPDRPSSANASAASANDKKQDKLITILENLQHSIAEILNTIGTPSSGAAGRTSPGSSSRGTPSSSVSRVPPYSQRPETGGKDYPSGSREGKASSFEEPPGGPSVSGGPGGGGLTSDRDTPPGRPSITGTPSSGDTFTPPKKYGPGLPFRCAATYAGSYGHEYEKPSLHHASHYGVSSNHDFTPHMIEAKWNVETGWEPAYVVPHQNISLYPSAKVLLRGQQVYDVMQALMGFDNRIRMFRPNLHLDRLRRSAGRMGLPDFDANEMIICLKRLILTDASFLPPSYSNGSLELRLVMMGVDDDMRFKPAEDVVLYIFANRHTTNTVAEITKPQALFADSQYSRASVGGIGEFMTSSNDALTLLVTQIAQSQGYNDVLWLHSKEELIQSLNDASVFVLIINELGKRELITPPLNGLIVPGVIRQTILEMTRHWNEFDVTERSISIHEIRTLRRQGRLLEMFSANTLANVVPILSIYYAPVRSLIRIPTLEQRDPLFARLNRAIHAIEYGLIVHPWGEIV